MNNSRNTAKNLTSATKAYVTERNNAGKDRTWGLQLVTGEAVKIAEDGLYWLCDEPPQDLTYDYPPLCWNLRNPSKTRAEALTWLADSFRVGEAAKMDHEAPKDEWTIVEVSIVEFEPPPRDGIER